MRKAIVIGLTGQTGAGKTTVADGLRHFGYQVIKADEIARLVTEKGSPVLQELAAVFGKDILKEDGTLGHPSRDPPPHQQKDQRRIFRWL